MANLGHCGFELLERAVIPWSAAGYLPRPTTVPSCAIPSRGMRTVGGRLVLGWLAVMGPIAFTIAWIVAEVLQDGYSLRRDYISELASLDARHAWIMITGFFRASSVNRITIWARCTGALTRPAGLRHSGPIRPRRSR